VISRPVARRRPGGPALSGPARRIDIGAPARRPRGEPVTLLFNKPYGVLCQFTSDGARPCLADHVPVPGVYPAGRLDRDSEGLLVLTSDGRLQHRIANPARRVGKTYLVQVEGEPDEAALAALRAGPVLQDGPTRPCAVRRIGAPDWLWPRDPPIRHRARIPTSWLEVVIDEGRNRQVRRMTAAVGFPTLRLVRVRIGPWTLDGLAPGQWRRLRGDELRP
jgi:23S rRNA pseudouridine2457 synthase